MRKGRFFRKLRFDPTIDRYFDASQPLQSWRGELSSAVHRLRYHGRQLQGRAEQFSRDHPGAALLIAGTATGLLLWTLLRRPKNRRVEGMERLEHW